MWGFDGAGRYAHSGMLRAALALRQELHQSGIFSRIYEYRDTGDHQQSHNRRADSSLHIPLVSCYVRSTSYELLSLSSYLV
jgi:hypothetical protein